MTRRTRTSPTSTLAVALATVSLANGITWASCQQRMGHGDAMKATYRRTSAT